MQYRNLTRKDVMKILKDDGWYQVDVRGSHHYFKHPIKKGKVTVPVHGNKTLKIKTIITIFKQAQIYEEE
jgi:predicted RNA binding protein YcfA (HicA-like mRNA interferase family)